VTLHAPADPAGADATRSCRALDRVEPAVWHPPSPAFSSADGPNVTAFDALVATRVRRSAARAARTTFTTASSKSRGSDDPGRLPSTSAQLDRPACASWPRTLDPPPIPRLCRPGPASGAPSPPAPEGEGARPCRFRDALHAPGAHGHAPLVDFCNRKRSASTTDEPPKPRPRVGPRGFRRAPHLGSGPARGLGRPLSQPSFHRSGAEVSRVRGRLTSAPAFAVPTPAPPATIARDESFAPTRSALGHLLSHPPAAPRLESPRYAPKGPRVVDRFRRLAWGPACAGVPAGPPPASLREKKMRSAAPEVPSSEGPTLSGGALFHSLSPTCGVEPAPFQPPLLAAHGRCDGGAATRPFTSGVD
jgi:hypothetical protein